MAIKTILITYDPDKCGGDVDGPNDLYSQIENILNNADIRVFMRERAASRKERDDVADIYDED